jgi:hypothetical protein
MGRGMAGVRREGMATCGVYAGVWLVGRRGSVAARGCEARGAREEGREGGSTAHGPAGRPRRAGPGKPRCGDMRRRRRRALERQGTHPISA